MALTISQVGGLKQTEELFWATLKCINEYATSLPNTPGASQEAEVTMPLFLRIVQSFCSALTLNTWKVESYKIIFSNLFTGQIRKLTPGEVKSLPPDDGGRWCLAKTRPQGSLLMVFMYYLKAKSGSDSLVRSDSASCFSPFLNIWHIQRKKNYQSIALYNMVKLLQNGGIFNYVNAKPSQQCVPAFCLLSGLPSFRELTGILLQVQGNHKHPLS